MDTTATVFAAATRASRLYWAEDEDGSGYWVRDNIEEIVDVRGTLDEVTRAIVAAVAPLGKLEWSAASAGHLTAHIGGDDWVELYVGLSMDDMDDGSFPTIEDMDAPAISVAAALAA